MKTAVIRRATFNAAHQLKNKSWSEQKKRRSFWFMCQP
jgi:6-pyruvoyl-tetrahydropterin synthase